MSGTNNSVDRALALLRLVAAHRAPMRFVDLAAATGIPKATLHSLLASLEAAGFLRRGEDGYRIGIAAFEVGTAMAVPSSLREAGAPWLDHLVATTGESCHLGILVGGDVVYLDRRDSGHGLRFASRIGQRLPAYGTGLGKAMLALLSDAQIEAIYPHVLPAITTRTVTSRTRLLELLAEIRQNGYAVESEESSPGVCCIGLATSLPEGSIGLSITVPVQRASVRELPRYLPGLTEALGHIRDAAVASHWLDPERSIVPAPAAAAGGGVAP